MSARKKTSKKTSSSGLVYQSPTAIIAPNDLSQRLEVVCRRTGASGGDTTTYFTVPNGMVYDIENIFNTFDTNITGDSTKFVITRSDGLIIWQRYSSRSSPLGRPTPYSLIGQVLRISAGDTIKIVYETTDAQGDFGFSTIGTLRADPSQFPPTVPA